MVIPRTLSPGTAIDYIGKPETFPAPFMGCGNCAEREMTDYQSQYLNAVKDVQWGWSPPGYGTNWETGPQSGFSAEEMKHLQAGGVILRKAHTWSPSPGGSRTVRWGPFFSDAELDAAAGGMASDLHAFGYQEPRWWQYWRWGERRPSKEILEAMSRLRASSSPPLE